MAHPYHHAVSSVQKWGGRPEDYQPIRDWSSTHEDLETTLNLYTSE